MGSRWAGDPHKHIAVATALKPHPIHPTSGIKAAEAVKQVWASSGATAHPAQAHSTTAAHSSVHPGAQAQGSVLTHHLRARRLRHPQQTRQTQARQAKAGKAAQGRDMWAGDLALGNAATGGFCHLRYQDWAIRWGAISSAQTANTKKPNLNLRATLRNRKFRNNNHEFHARKGAKTDTNQLAISRPTHPQAC